MAASKTELRRGLKQARLEMLDEAHRLASQTIVKRLESIADWSKVGSVHLFVPIQELAEVDINEFIRYLEDNYPNIHLATSRLIEDEWEIVGLHGGEPPEQFGVIIVPMLGFDPKTLHRIGYGGGYYDKFLAGQKSAQKIGLCFEQGRLDGLPVERHDVVLNLVVTEAGTVGQ